MRNIQYYAGTDKKNTMKSYHEGHCRKASCGEGHEDKIQRRLVVNEYGGYNIS
ncbi:MAG: hypothetical protein ACYSYU_10535 [Planctomycetota bacterium]|jgi:hypothetical protein